MPERKTPAAGLASLPATLENILALKDAATWCEGLIRAFARAETDKDRDVALDAIGDAARVLTWIVAPLAEKAFGMEARSIVALWSEQLKDFRRPWVRFHPADFPKETDRTQQILDAVENVAGLLQRRRERRERRNAA